MEAEGVLQDPGHLSAFTKLAHVCENHYCSDRSKFLADCYVSPLPAKKEGLGSHLEVIAEVSMNVKFIFPSPHRCFFPAFSVPWWNRAILFHSLSSHSWVREAGRASLKQVAILGSASLAGGRVTHHKYGCWFSEGVLEKGRVTKEGKHTHCKYIVLILLRIRVL